MNENSLKVSGLERMKADAVARSLAIKVISRQPAGNLPEAAAQMGVEVQKVIKSLVIKHKDGSFFFALVPGGRSISWPKLRALLGVNKLSLPQVDVALAATGYERGTITPLGSLTPWPVIVDASIVTGSVVLGAGERGYSTIVDSAELIKALEATVADISDSEANA